MCGRIAQFGPFREIVELLRWPNPVQAPEEAPPRYNVPPSTRVLILNAEGEELLARRVRWGWRPHWAQDKPPPINARAEKIAVGPFFRAAWPHRALCPIDCLRDEPWKPFQQSVIANKLLLIIHSWKTELSH